MRIWTRAWINYHVYTSCRDTIWMMSIDVSKIFAGWNISVWMTVDESFQFHYFEQQKLYWNCRDFVLSIRNLTINWKENDLSVFHPSKFFPTKKSEHWVHQYSSPRAYWLHLSHRGTFVEFVHFQNFRKLSWGRKWEAPFCATLEFGNWVFEWTGRKARELPEKVIQLSKCIAIEKNYTMLWNRTNWFKGKWNKEKNEITTFE